MIIIGPRSLQDPQRPQDHAQQTPLNQLSLPKKDLLALPRQECLMSVDKPG